MQILDRDGDLVDLGGDIVCLLQDIAQSVARPCRLNLLKTPFHGRNGTVGLSLERLDHLADTDKTFSNN